jgi:hypothetical protein
LNLGPGAFFGDRAGRKQKRDEPIELDTEAFAKSCSCPARRRRGPLLGSSNFNIGSPQTHRVAPADRIRGSDKETWPRDQVRLCQPAAFTWGYDSRPSPFIPDAQKNWPVVAALKPKAHAAAIFSCTPGINRNWSESSPRPALTAPEWIGRIPRCSPRTDFGGFVSGRPGISKLLWTRDEYYEKQHERNRSIYTADCRLFKAFERESFPGGCELINHRNCRE